MGGKPVLTYTFNLYAKSPALDRKKVFVNAFSGKVEFNESLIHSGESEGTAFTAYSGTQKIITDSLANFFRLRDNSRGNGVETYNALRTRNFGSAVDFIDSNNVWNNINANLDEYATDAHWGTQKFYDYLDTMFQRNSIDGFGFRLRSYVHVDENLVNAFWDGQRMSYGDGDPMFNRTPLTTLDIVGHEITHGLTDFTSDLIYANESGALNESFSDIFGTALEFWARPDRANWDIGEDMGSAIRSMSDPKLLGDPDTYEGENWIDQDCFPTRFNDRCGVHTNSGVQNKWFYLLSEGGKGVNDLQDSFDLDGIGMSKAEQIAYRNMLVYLTPSSNYSDAQFFSIVSAVDIHGTCSPEVAAVTDAWYAVGIGNKYVDSVSASFKAIPDTSFCFFPAEVRFEGTGSNVLEFEWQFGNGQSSIERSPTVEYTSLGKYDVRLIADGGACGTDTLVRKEYIVLDTAIGCSYLLRDTISTTVSECKGRLFDSGGLNGNYTLDESGVFVIDVPSADYISLKFISIDVESDGLLCNKDFLEVFDGPFGQAKSMGRFCTNRLPVNGELNSSSNVLSIQFLSDEINVASGFLLEWECQTASQNPIADFSVSSNETCLRERNFRNLSTQGSGKQKWYFGDGAISEELHPSHEYQENGIYDVKLVVENSFGKDSITKTSLVTINEPVRPDALRDTFCLGENAEFRISSVNEIAWYSDTLGNALFIGGTLNIGKLTGDTTLFIRETTNSTSQEGGKMDNVGEGDYSDNNDFIIFDVHRPIILETMLFYSNRSGTRTLDIFNHRGEVVVSRNVFIPGNTFFVNLNIELDADTSYMISISDRNTGLFKNTSGASFPYFISDLVTLKGSNLPNGQYPYFYRWKVRENNCESSFNTVSATLDTSCVVSSLAELNSDKRKYFIYPNPFESILTISVVGSEVVSNAELSVYSAFGQRAYSKSRVSIRKDQKFDVDLSHLPSGVYYVELKGRNFSQSNKLIKAR